MVSGDETLASFSRFLGLALGRRVIDRTLITDKFSVVLEFSSDESTPGTTSLGRLRQENSAADNVPRAETLSAALQQQLGLKLEPIRTPNEFIVVDRVERPTPN